MTGAIEPRRMAPEEAGAVLALVQRAFAFMDGRVDPPSSFHRMTVAAVAEHPGEIWVIGTPPLACAFLTVTPGALYLGKLAVDDAARGQGLSRRLVAQAEARARALNLPAVELQVRVELTQNQAIFRGMGFVQTEATAHPGYTRTTSLTFRKAVTPSAGCPPP